MASDLSPADFASLRHHHEFGYPGTPSKERVLASEWEKEAFSKPLTSPWSLVSKLTKAQVPNLMNGFCPQQMEDKWFIYSDGPAEDGKVSVHFFRSWTGYKYAQIDMQLAKEEDGGEGEVTTLTWEDDNEKVNGLDFEGAKETLVHLCEWVLDVKLPASA